jgi:predicted AlkP superfamily phosphohydrolase/phosphomutase
MVQAGELLAYVGPGAGIAIGLSVLTVVMLVVGALLVLIATPVSVAVVCARKLGGARRRGRRWRRVVVLGLDGLDPRLLERLMKDGRMPHAASLAQRGCFGPLATTAPAISPVAWSSFLTGMDPSRHRIFDFIRPDWPSYRPGLSSARVRQPRRAVRLGCYRLPLGGPDVQSLRKGVPFWTILGDAGIESTILRVPATFPPEPFKGRLLSGMCVPDLLGTQGTYTLLTTDPHRLAGQAGRVIRLSRQDRSMSAQIGGPAHPFRADQTPLSTRLRVAPAAEAGSVVLHVGAQRVKLTVGQMSRWVRLTFPAGPMQVRGLVQFCLLSPWPRVELYMSAIHLDPESPVAPIGHPALFSDHLAKRGGSFGTLGLMEDTSALDEQALPEEAFLQQCWGFFEERKAMFFEALSRKANDLVVCVFDTPDRLQHMFWPVEEALAARPPGRDADVIGQLYGAVDDLLGRTLRQLDDRSLLLVISDHGFTSFRCGVNLNAYLWRSGYLALREGAQMGADWLAGVDWSRTKAYAMGLGGIYLNRRGREGQGILADDEADDLAAELTASLESLRYSEALSMCLSPQPIRRVLQTRCIYRGPYADDGPDLIVGYNRGYRCSWGSARGQVAREVLVPNRRHWRGDHCVDPELVPGVLLASEPLRTASAGLMDLAPTVMEAFGVEAPSGIQGRSLLDGDPRHA